MSQLPIEIVEASDPELGLVRAALLELDPVGARMAKVLRRTFDQLYNGQETGRFRWEQLFKTEKTHFGTIVEINLQREFEFDDGDKMDYRIVGVEVDCKYSQRVYGWMIPPEAVGHICLVVTANDERGIWSAGLVRASPEHVRTATNRDGKAYLNERGQEAIIWLTRDADLPANVLLQLPPSDLERIFHGTSGQRRINELLRRCQGRPIGRAAIATVARQADFMKRLRSNGGARTSLQPEGILVLGGNYNVDRSIAMHLGLPVPSDGEVVSTRVVVAEAGPEPTGDRTGVAEIAGSYWRVAELTDPVMAAPEVPRPTRKTQNVGDEL